MKQGRPLLSVPTLQSETKFKPIAAASFLCRASPLMNSSAAKTFAAAQ